LGFALIFGAARVVNLYHGTFYLLGAYLFATFSRPARFDLPEGAFWTLQILIIIYFIYFAARIVRDRKEVRMPLLKKVGNPALLVLIGEIPLLLLFLAPR
jgi:branched-chain amino acid transport system permease protein